MSNHAPTTSTGSVNVTCMRGVARRVDAVRRADRCSAPAARARRSAPSGADSARRRRSRCRCGRCRCCRRPGGRSPSCCSARGAVVVAFAAIGAAVADEVHRRADRRSDSCRRAHRSCSTSAILPLRAAHVDLAVDVRGRQRRAVRAARRQRDQVVLAGRDRAAERLLVEVPAAAGRRRVLQRPAGEVDRARRRGCTARRSRCDTSRRRCRRRRRAG